MGQKARRRVAREREDGDHQLGDGEQDQQAPRRHPVGEVATREAAEPHAEHEVVTMVVVACRSRPVISVNQHCHTTW